MVEIFNETICTKENLRKPEETLKKTKREVFLLLHRGELQLVEIGIQTIFNCREKKNESTFEKT